MRRTCASMRPSSAENTLIIINLFVVGCLFLILYYNFKVAHRMQFQTLIKSQLFNNPRALQALWSPPPAENGLGALMRARQTSKRVHVGVPTYLLGGLRIHSLDTYRLCVSRLLCSLVLSPASKVQNNFQRRVLGCQSPNMWVSSTSNLQGWMCRVPEGPCAFTIEIAHIGPRIRIPEPLEGPGIWMVVKTMVPF